MYKAGKTTFKHKKDYEAFLLQSALDTLLNQIGSWTKFQSILFKKCGTPQTEKSVSN
jgi:hypothetical protein